MPKHSLSMKFLHIVQQAMRNLMEFTEFAATAYTEGEIDGIMWRDVFYVHEPYFLMPGHKY